MFQIFTHIIRNSNYKTAGLLAYLPWYKLEWIEPPLEFFLIMNLNILGFIM